MTTPPIHRPTYTQYRSYGHNPLTAAILSTSPLVWVLAALLVGLLLNIPLWIQVWRIQ
jgi:hypothetical protein